MWTIITVAIWASTSTEKAAGCCLLSRSPLMVFFVGILGKQESRLRRMLEVFREDALCTWPDRIGGCKSKRRSVRLEEDRLR